MLELIVNGTKLLNAIVVAGVLITAFALVVYIALYNRRSAIGRGFALLLLCIIGAYLGDLLAQLATGSPDLWLRFQWIGIAMLPAAMLDLSDVLLRATADVSPTRRIAARGAYLGGLVVVLLVSLTTLIATPGIDADRLPHLTPGPIFNLFALFYFGAGGWAMYNVIEARRRALTTTTRRRMTYFVMAFPAPMIGIFPYLLPIGWPDLVPDVIPWLGILVLNMGVGAAITIMGYTVAYFGAGAPDRVIKRRLVKYLIRGPLLAALVIAAFVLSSRVERWMQLPGAYIGLITSAAIVLLTQLYIVTFQPTLDRLIAGDDSAEVARLQQFTERLMTTSDLQQYLENLLAALCDLLRARTAFVMQIACDDCETPPLLATIGNVDLQQVAVHPTQVRTAIRGAGNGNGADNLLPEEPHFVSWNGYWLMPLVAADLSVPDGVLGVIGLAARSVEPDLNSEELHGAELLMLQAARAIEDSIKQSRAFDALDRIVPEASDMTRRMSSVRNPGAPTLADFELAPQGYDDFTHLVRDALSQFWGGPKLAESPLLSLTVVSDALHEQHGNATKALRAVLLQAIERLKPNGQRSFTATEWMLYNILELKVVQGQKVRDVASKLFMSESDLYRKQRSAFEEVARVVKDMEREARMRAPEGDAEASAAPQP